MSKTTKEHIKHWQENGYTIKIISSLIFAEKGNNIVFLYKLE